MSLGQKKNVENMKKGIIVVFKEQICKQKYFFPPKATRWCSSRKTHARSLEKITLKGKRKSHKLQN